MKKKNNHKIKFSEDKKMTKIEEYELKDNESNYMTTMQPAFYGNMIYKQTFSPTEAYDVAVVSLRMGQFNSVDVVPVGQIPPLTLKIVMAVINLDTKETSKYSGTPEGLVNHGVLPWVNMALEKPVHFEPGQKGELVFSSEGGYEYVGTTLKGKSSIFYITRDPNITYLRGALFRYQYWNKSWLKLVFNNKPYNASFKLWSKKNEVVIVESEIEPLSICPNCGFIFPQDNIITPGKPTP
jgi:hypothetical protein